MNVASLSLNVNSSSVVVAGDRLIQLSNQAGKAEKATDALKTSWGKLMGVVGAVTGAVMAAKGISDTVVQYENLEAQLRTATGSADKAAQAFDRLKVFATETPFALNQSVEAFVQLVNRGLTPSERALRAYGNTAAAANIDLTTLVQGVANATVGEFEILKQIGLKAQTEGDKIRMTFRGTTEEVANNSRAIQAYMIKLGENNFAGAMEERMKTLGGAFSNLGDAWDQMLYAMAKSGPSDAVKAVLGDITGLLNNLTAAFESGQATKYIEAFFNKFSTGASAAKEGFALIRADLDALGKDTESVSGAIYNWLKDAFLYLPENVAAAVKAVGATLGYLMDLGERTGRYLVNAFTLAFNNVIDNAKALWEALKAMDPQIYLKAEAANRKKLTDALFGSGLDDLLSGLGDATDAYGEEVTAIMNAHDASVALTAQLIKEGDARRAAKDAAPKATGDGLAQYEVKGTAVGPQFADLQKSLSGEIAEIQRGYNDKRAIIIAEENATDEVKKHMRDQLAAMEADDQRKRFETATGNLQLELDQMNAANTSLMEVERVAYEQRQMALDQAFARKRISEEEYYKASILAQQIYNEKTKQAERNTALARMQMQSELLGQMGSITAGLEGLFQQGSRAQKAAFLASKAIALGQAYVNMESAVLKAEEAGAPYASAAMGMAQRMMGMASIAVIAAQTVQGVSQWEHGGMVPAGEFGIVGEAGPELIRGPAIVTSARTTADLASRGMTGGGSVQVNVINNAGVNVDVQESSAGDAKTINIIVNRVKKEIAGGIRDGNSEVASSLESTYRIRRGGAGNMI